MKPTKSDDKDFALKLVLLEIKEWAQCAQDIRADRFTQKQLLELIKSMK
jgi:hypothetical protein